MTVRISDAARSAAADAIASLANGGTGAGTIGIYDGTQPAGPSTAVTTQTLLAEVDLVDPAFAAASAGAAALSGTPLSTTGVANGTAAWFRLSDSDNTAVLDGSAGTSGTDLILNTAAISVGVNVQITSGSITMPAS
jgi:hypothetical protein